MPIEDEPDLLGHALTQIQRLSAAQEQPMPMLDFTAISEPQKMAASGIQHCLWNLEQFASAFQSDLELFDYSNRKLLEEIRAGRMPEISERRPNGPSEGWITIAGRDGAMSIYHFGIAANGVRDGLGQCPIVAARIDQKELRAIIREFEGRMPAYVEMRDAVSHTAEVLKNPAKMREHVPSDRVVVTGGFTESKFTMTWEGKLLTYDLSQTTLDKLEVARRRIWDLFR